MGYTVTIFRDIVTTSTPFYVDVFLVFDRIKKGHSKKIVEKIRKEPDKKQRDILKKDLPSVCFSGRFKTRSIKGCNKVVKIVNRKYTIKSNSMQGKIGKYFLNYVTN